jgi:hypothetical protein
MKNKDAVSNDRSAASRARVLALLLAATTGVTATSFSFAPTVFYTASMLVRAAEA